MKNLRRASLVLIGLVIFSAFTHGVYTLGEQTAFNRLLWQNIEHSGEIKPVPKSEQRELYNSMKLNFAFKNQGDLK